MSDKLHPLKVVHAEKMAPQIIQLLMEPEMPIRYQAGDYIMLGFQQDDLKPFSIAAAPRKDGLIECHIRNQADSEWMQKLFATKTGDHLVMEGPKPQMQLKGYNTPILFVAGGTGFAPMKALLDELLRKKSELPIEFFWGARSADDLYMHEELSALATNHANLSYTPVISDDCEHWQGETGLVHEHVLRKHPDLKGYTVYLCGPWPMVQKAKEDFFAAGLNQEHYIF